MEVEYQPGQEGIDHINVYSKSILLVGRQLSNFYHSPFQHTYDGKFESVEGYWYWLATGSKHDILRALWGFDAKNEGKKFPRVDVVDFNECVREAIRCKLRQNRTILENLTLSSLPLTHYYWFGSVENPKIVRLEKHQWIVDELTRIRGLMRAKRGLI